MTHKCDGCIYKGEHQEMEFRPVGVCLKEPNLLEAFCSYKATSCPHKLTNYERIKNMSVEEMAELLASIWVDEDDLLKHIGGVFVFDTESSIEEWLESEVETE